jgi:formylglycine-generating enzyme
MNKLFILITILFFASSCRQKIVKNFVFVEGGNFINTKSNYFGKGMKINGFFIGKYEVTQKEWIEIMGNNPSKFEGDNLPVETISWYDCVDYCNKRSLKEGLKICYNIDKNQKDPSNFDNRDDLKWKVTIDDEANGYRLPKVAEWEYASGGGQLSENYIYSGSNNIEKVAWFWSNSGDKNLSGTTWNWSAVQKNNCKTKTVGSKESNELGIFNMSGNVREWCWEWENKGPEPKERSWRGGGWAGGDFCCESSYKGSYVGNSKGADIGFRVCRNK